MNSVVKHSELDRIIYFQIDQSKIEMISNADELVPLNGYYDY